MPNNSFFGRFKDYSQLLCCFLPASRLTHEYGWSMDRAEQGRKNSEATAFLCQSSVSSDNSRILSAGGR